MINIRKSLFETNSSSVHAICVAKENNYDIPKSLHFSFGEFGWEERVLSSPEALASYLYTAIYICGENERYDVEDYKNYIYETLGKYGCDCTFETPVYDKHYGWFDSGYIDHGYELVDFVDSIKHSEKRLLRYLFSPDSYIVTGNDNVWDMNEYFDEYITPEDEKKTDVYMKYN